MAVALVRSWPRAHVAFEEGTQAQWLRDVLIDQVERVVVCNVRGKHRWRTRTIASMPMECRRSCASEISSRCSTARRALRNPLRRGGSPSPRSDAPETETRKLSIVHCWL